MYFHSIVEKKCTKVKGTELNKKKWIQWNERLTNETKLNLNPKKNELNQNKPNWTQLGGNKPNCTEPNRTKLNSSKPHQTNLD